MLLTGLRLIFFLSDESKQSPYGLGDQRDCRRVVVHGDSSKQRTSLLLCLTRFGEDCCSTRSDAGSLKLQSCRPRAYAPNTKSHAWLTGAGRTIFSEQLRWTHKSSPSERGNSHSLAKVCDDDVYHFLSYGELEEGPGVPAFLHGLKVLCNICRCCKISQEGGYSIVALCVCITILCSAFGPVYAYMEMLRENWTCAGTDGMQVFFKTWFYIGPRKPSFQSKLKRLSWLVGQGALPSEFPIVLSRACMAYSNGGKEEWVIRIEQQCSQSNQVINAAAFGPKSSLSPHFYPHVLYPKCKVVLEKLSVEF
ncbi:hypothetical protein SELMODRAFT_402497 [Selaginella moellendorffii]|uniref:Uncharacterized protein n=1 Tax=Selaginella moellendorffii TaxID=88036 RepID=D8QQU7_SELML|nr:hypothetical protein SELMODRAFT_402497 [Selaginella moellendorffii]